MQRGAKYAARASRRHSRRVDLRLRCAVCSRALAWRERIARACNRCARLLSCLHRYGLLFAEARAREACANNNPTRVCARAHAKGALVVVVYVVVRRWDAAWKRALQITWRASAMFMHTHACKTRIWILLYNFNGDILSSHSILKYVRPACVRLYLSTVYTAQWNTRCFRYESGSSRRTRSTRCATETHTTTVARVGVNAPNKQPDRQIVEQTNRHTVSIPIHYAILYASTRYAPHFTSKCVCVRVQLSRFSGRAFM